MTPSLTQVIPSKHILSGCTTKPISWDTMMRETNPKNFPIISMNQTHSANCNEIITISDSHEKEVPDTDAFWTTQTNVILRVRTADCLPILFYHPTGIIGAIHAGRKGTENHITQRTFEHVLAQHPDPRGYIIWCGPAICKTCYQIDSIQDIHYDLLSENRSQLQQVLDIDRTQLIESGLCTACQNTDFYSYRKEKTEKRLYSFIARHGKK